MQTEPCFPLSRKAPPQGDPYGADIPSPIERPDIRPSDPIRRGSLPRGVYRPIPVNRRDVAQEMSDIVFGDSPKMARFLVSTWNAQSEAIKFEEIANAVATGELPQNWNEEFEELYANAIEEECEFYYKRAIRKGSHRMVAGIEGLGIEHDFQLLGGKLTEWIEKRSATLVVDITDIQRQALRKLLRNQLIIDPLGPREIGILIRPLIGNTEREAAWVSQRFNDLLKGGLSEEKALRQAEIFSGYLRRKRAIRIARTELAFAYNNGSRLAVQDAIEGGAFPPGDGVVKVWYAQEDERTCPFCGQLHGQIVGFEQTFPAVTKQLPNVFVPPAHPHCRCVILYQIDEAPEPEVKPVE